VLDLVRRNLPSKLNLFESVLKLPYAKVRVLRSWYPKTNRTFFVPVSDALNKLPTEKNPFPIASNKCQCGLVNPQCYYGWWFRNLNPLQSLRVFGCLPSRTDLYRFPFYHANNLERNRVHYDIAGGKVVVIEYLGLILIFG